MIETLWTSFWTTGCIVLAAMMIGAGLLHLLPRLGGAGRRVSEAFCRAPLLDLPITYFTVGPLFFGPIFGSVRFGAAWAGLAGGIAGQVASVMAWTVLHELANRRHLKGPRIVHVLNRKVGRVRNHTAVWVTAGAVPMFWIVRVAQYVLWPPIRALVRFPRYNSGEWVNCSRQKFEGLVGHDLIWCLYCDWMTGIWSLGSEMLRNVESFWCPIRFTSDKKCANCAVDFPDVDSGWVPATGGMAGVAGTLDQKYPGPGGENSWFGHPARLTVEGKARGQKPGAHTQDPAR